MVKYFKGNFSEVSIEEIKTLLARVRKGTAHKVAKSAVISPTSNVLQTKMLPMLRVFTPNAFITPI